MHTLLDNRKMQSRGKRVNKIEKNPFKAEGNYYLRFVKSKRKIIATNYHFHIQPLPKCNHRTTETPICALRLGITCFIQDLLL